MVFIEGVDLDALNYTIHVPYNGTGPTGGDPLKDNLNIWYEVCDIAAAPRPQPDHLQHCRIALTLFLPL